MGQKGEIGRGMRMKKSMLALVALAVAISMVPLHPENVRSVLSMVHAALTIRSLYE